MTRMRPLFPSPVRKDTDVQAYPICAAHVDNSEVPRQAGNVKASSYAKIGPAKTSTNHLSAMSYVIRPASQK
jgi:hypothetical protein